MSKLIRSVESFGDLIDFLQEWRSAEDPFVYDFGGMVQLFSACLDNLRIYAVEGELEDIGAYLDTDQTQFLQRIAEIVQGNSG